MTQTKDTTLRNFGGGWNTSDSETSLDNKYQPVSDNVDRGTDGGFSPRYGTELYYDLERDVKAPVTQAFTINVENTKAGIRVTKTAHGLQTGDHVTISGFAGAFATIPEDQINGTHGIVRISADQFYFYTRKEANATTSGTRTFTYVADNHYIGGEPIFGRLYNDELIIFSNTGEIVSIKDNVITPIWNFGIAYSRNLEPWGPCDRVSAEVIKGKLIVVNGRNNDKPLEYNGTLVNYLVDGATISNAHIPRADQVIAANRYTLLVNTEWGETMVEISAKNTLGTYSREPDPADAVEIDVGMLTQSVKPVLTGAGTIRDKVFLTFYDSSMLGTLGIYSGELHEPDFSDVISLFGSFSHNTIVSFGNDIFCASSTGIMSVSMSQMSGTFIPDPVSEFIRPSYTKHVNRLSQYDLANKCFAVLNGDDRRYMLFMPKYSDVEIRSGSNPIFMTSLLARNNQFMLVAPNHNMDEGDFLQLSSITGLPSFVDPEWFEGNLRVTDIIDDNTLVVQSMEVLPNTISWQGGGENVVIRPVNDETIGYIYEFNSVLKIRRWYRYKGLNWRWGTRAQDNSLYFGRGLKVFRMGTISYPIHADNISDYDYRQWTAGKTYKVGDRVRYSGKEVYRCVIEHVATGSFDDELQDVTRIWERYYGDEIEWALETPWSDFGMRVNLKQIVQISHDTEGSASFSLQIFTDRIYKDPESNQLVPYVSLDFAGNDRDGFGMSNVPFGSGRRTREEWLWSMPARGKLFKLRWSGATRNPLKVAAISMSYLRGSAGA